MIIPTGYIKGNPNANSSQHSDVKGSKWYHNKLTGERLRLKNDIPEGFEYGANYIWINDSNNNKQHPAELEIPINFTKGRISLNTGKKYNKHD